MPRRYDHFHATVLLSNDMLMEIEGGYGGTPQEFLDAHELIAESKMIQMAALWTDLPRGVSITRLETFRVAG